MPLPRGVGAAGVRSLLADAAVERAVAVGDAKRFDRSLDQRASDGDPVAQIRDYVLLSKRPFGILTNGRSWRLYSRDAPLVERATHEVDLVALLEDGDADDLRYFAAFFGAAAFTPAPDGRTFLERALDDSRLHAVEVSEALERSIFGAVPELAAGFLVGEPRTRGHLDAAFANSLVFLYRVLFCLFAEARNLLPVQSQDYRHYSIAEHRLKVADLLDRGHQLSSSNDGLYGELRALFRMIHAGDEALGVTEYNGGLFDPELHPWLEMRSVPDALVAPALDRIYRVGRELVDYRNLSVRTLGAVYERLLAWDLADNAGELELVESPRRHEMGAYFTPEEVVDAIVERTLAPILEKRSMEARDRGLRGEEALDHLLSINVLDPAIGSGHFLVGAVGFLAQSIATDPAYDGDLSLDELRRLVAERCLYGVDLSELAVELARLSLWLVTARVGEPLTFLANLRVGDSLVGADTQTLLDPATGLLESHLAAHAGELLRQANEVQERATRTGADAREKKRLARELEGLRLPLEVFAEHSIQRYGPPEGRERLHWPLEFPEIFVDEYGAARPDGGFDAVIGNPPYIRVQEIGRAMADWCRNRYETPRGAFDAYVVFLERGLSLLAPSGRLGFIVPNKLFKLDYGQTMRGIFSERELVDEVLDFGAAQVFAEATNYTCILILDRAGAAEFDYRRIRGTRAEVLAELATGGTLPAERFATGLLGREPWTLVPPEEADVIRAASEGSERLDAVTEQIFQGHITSADSVYVLEGRGTRGAHRVVWSRASNRELELEPDLLHPLASGGDVRRYAFAPLDDVLLFPYARRGSEVGLVTANDVNALSHTHDYLVEHEAALRGREHGKMDHDGWYGYVYPKNLDAHDPPKLAVPRLCDRLRVALDPHGGIYLDNVDVNGILLAPDRASEWLLVTVLNSRLLDWIFRRRSVPFQNDFWSANKQFIAGLPIRIPAGVDADPLNRLGERLHELAAAIHEEKGAFLSWLASTFGVTRASLPGRRTLDKYEALTGAQVVAALARGRARLDRDPREREPRELVEREHRASVERLLPLTAALMAAEAEADELVYQLYGLTPAMRALVDAEYA